MASEAPENPFLAGNYAPVRSEDDFELTGRGDQPRELRGAQLRVGPNPQFPPRGAYDWFGGDGMVHGFYLGDGRARYRNRYVRTPKWRLEHDAGGRCSAASAAAPATLQLPAVTAASPTPTSCATAAR